MGLRHLLDRESHWVSWKGHGCREFERESLEMLSARVPPADKMQEKPAPMRASKPQLAGHLSGLLKTLKNPEWKVSSTSLSNQSMRTHAMRKMCDTYLDRLIEEEKPENQIEEEYRAKRNKVFMWQCRRLFGHQYLRFYAQKDVSTKTEFMDYVRAVRGKPLSTSTTQPTGQAAASGAAPAHPDGCVEDSPQDLPADVADPPGTAVVPDAVLSGSADVTTSTPDAVAAAAASATPAELAAAAASAAEAAVAAPVPARPIETVLTVDESPTPPAPLTGDSAVADPTSTNAARGTKRELAAGGSPAMPTMPAAGDTDAHRDKKAKQ